MSEAERSDLTLLIATIVAAIPTCPFITNCWVHKDSLFNADQLAEWRILFTVVLAIEIAIYIGSYYFWRRRPYRYLLTPVTALGIGTLIAVSVSQIFGKLIIKPTSMEVFLGVVGISLVIGGSYNALIFGVAKSLSLPDIRKTTPRDQPINISEELP
jgi:hypothetical protein